MAACVAACKLSPNKFLQVHSVFAKDTVLSLSLRLCRREVFAFGHGERATNVNSRTLCTVSTKRKLVRTVVTKRWDRFQLEQTTNAMRHRKRSPRYRVYNEIKTNTANFPGVFVNSNVRSYGGFCASSSLNGVTLKSVSKAQPLRMTDVSSPKAVHPRQCMRQFSSRHGYTVIIIFFYK